MRSVGASLDIRIESAWRRRAFDAALLMPGPVLFWLSTDHPALLPVWAPWDFSWVEYLATALTLGWFWRGYALSAVDRRPPAWRIAAFLVGVTVIYGVLQTHFDYMAQHMFFLNRTQHVVMHHLGPFLIALAWPGATIKRGMPAWARSMVEYRALAAALRVVQQPLIAAVLFEGLFAFWLIPAVQFHAMLDERLYALMNWSMVIDGILFWCLVLDPRQAPPARSGFGVRAALAIVVMFPQIAIGATIAFAARDLYPFYDLCGRLYPNISALADQRAGGIISWIPPAMMSVVALLLVLNALRCAEERASAAATDPRAAAIAALASRWTGR
jgi:putative membrane protein